MKIRIFLRINLSSDVSQLPDIRMRFRKIEKSSELNPRDDEPIKWEGSKLLKGSNTAGEVE